MLRSGRTQRCRHRPSASIWARECRRSPRAGSPAAPRPWAGPADALDIEPEDARARVALLAGSRLERPCACRKPSSAFSGAPTRGPLPLVVAIGLLRRQSLDMQGEAARRRIGLGLAEARARLRQLVRDETAQIVRGPALHARRDFLGQQLEQEFGHGLSRRDGGVRACDPASQASQQPLAKRPHPDDIGLALGHADDAAGVEQIEQVARLQALVIGRQRQLRLARQKRGAGLLGIGEMAEQDRRCRRLEIVGGEFALGPQKTSP